MKKLINIVLFYFASVYLVFAQPAELNGKIKFAWGDEFNGTTINTDIWRVVDNFDNYGDGKGGVAIERNVSVSNGHLNCTVVKEIYNCPTYPINKITEGDCNLQWKTGSPYSYTYGRIDSQKKYNQQFGYAEAMMHFSNQPGLWPAFWTFVGDGLGSAHMNAGEIDIMERMGDSDAKTVTTNIHLNHCSGHSYMCPNGIGSFCGEAPPCWGRKHTLENEFWNSTKYAVYWDPTELIFYINDVRVRRMLNPGVVDPLKFILGMGVSTDMVTTGSQFPSTLYVDYIHVYSLQECLNSLYLGIGETYISNDGTPTMLLACDKVDGNGTNGGSLTMVATNSIAILPNFEVKQGGYLEARISNNGRVQTTEEQPVSQKEYHPIHMRGNSNPIVTTEKPVNEDLFTVSPNPVLNTASVNYSIASQVTVKITLYNIMGNLQDELVNENQQAGEHTYELDGANYKAGIYLLVFEAGGLTQKRTIVITK